MEHKPRILIADDEIHNLKVIEAMLLPLGYDIILARDGNEAYELSLSGNPDVILLDVNMPGLTGFEVTERLRRTESARLIPVVMVTALTDTDARIQALNAGADDFLTKPVNITELRARVSSLVKVKAYHDHMKNYQTRLEEDILKRTEELNRAYYRISSATLEITYRLTRASEYKDEDTGAHIIRMSHYCAIMARALGLNDAVVESLLHAAPMHDVGKIGIPDRILLKPGKLDDDEWEVMKQHTVIGALILEKSKAPSVRMGEMIALMHHERWDGLGYPKGIKGAKIPLAARIVSIADVFDALLSKRPYKEPFTLEKSFEIIGDMSGKNFDPRVVEAFFASRDEIITTLNRYQDNEYRDFINPYSQLP